MDRTRAFFFLLSFLLLTQLVSFGQEQPGPGVIIHADPRLAILLKKYPTRSEETPIVKTPEKKERDTSEANTTVVTRTPVVIYRGQGFRVQVYSGADRNKALSIKNDLMRRFPGVHTYMTFVTPSFRIRMGDYRTRIQAEAMMNQVKTIYHPCMIVPEDITITGYH